MLTLKGRNEEKVKFSAGHLKHELDKLLGDFKDLILAGPAPAPLLRARSYYRYRIMLRVQRMSALSQRLAGLIQSLAQLGRGQLSFMYDVFSKYSINALCQAPPEVPCSTAGATCVRPHRPGSVVQKRHRPRHH